MTEPKIVAMILVKNGEPWISKTLQSATDTCTEIVVLDDGSTDDTINICKSYPKVVDIQINQKNIPHDEARDRNYLLQIALKRNPDYIIQFDADEILQPNSKKMLLEEFEKYPNATVFEFQIINMWDKPNMYRVDGFLGNWWAKKLLKMKDQPDNLKIKNSKFKENLHCKHIPENARGWRHSVKSKVKIIHYGFYDKKVREAKYRHYNKIESDRDVNDNHKHLLELPGVYSGYYGPEFRYLPKGMYDETIPPGQC